MVWRTDGRALECRDGYVTMTVTKWEERERAVLWRLPSDRSSFRISSEKWVI